MKNKLVYILLITIILASTLPSTAYAAAPSNDNLLQMPWNFMPYNSWITNLMHTLKYECRSRLSMSLMQLQS